MLIQVVQIMQNSAKFDYKIAFKILNYLKWNKKYQKMLKVQQKDWNVQKNIVLFA